MNKERWLFLGLALVTGLLILLAGGPFAPTTIEAGELALEGWNGLVPDHPDPAPAGPTQATLSPPGANLEPSLLWTPLAVADDPLVRMPGTQPDQGVQLDDVGQCLSCHAGFDPVTEPGNWRGSMMAQAARDFLYWATMTVAGQDAIWAVGNPNATDICLRCHMTGGWLGGRSDPTNGSLMTGIDFDGVQCNVCHYMYDPFFEDTSDGIREGSDWSGYWDEAGGSTLSSDAAVTTYNQDKEMARAISLFNGQPFFITDTITLKVRPPITYTESGGGQLFISTLSNNRRASFADADPSHPFFYSRFHKSKYFCSGCHDISNPVLHNLGTDATERLPSETDPTYSYYHVERTFSEFMLSDYGLQGGAAGVGPYAPDQFNTSRPGNAIATCQDCHMADASGQAAKQGKAVVRPAESDEHPNSGVPQHDLTGGNMWVSAILASAASGSANYDAANDALLNQGPSALTLDMTAGDGLNAPALLAGVDRAESMLLDAAAIEAVSYYPVTGTLMFRVQNQTGHKLISGYPEGRRMFLNIRYYSGDTLLHEVNPYDSAAGTLKGLSGYTYYDPGGTLPDPAGLGPDESYVDELVYEMHGGSTLTGEDESFHFALGTHRYKDNRIPPKGFRVAEADERLSEPVWHGVSDPTFFSAAEYAGGYDEVNLGQLGVSVPGADRVEIELYYQTTSREYIEFLRDEINGTADRTTLPDETAYIIQSDPFFDQLKAWGDTIWQLWEHNKDLPGGAPVEMTGFTYYVTGGNHPPVAAADSYTTTEDQTLTVPEVEGVLDNDSDVDGDALTAVKESDPATGSLALADDGSFVYTPTLHFNGVVTFTYHANDGLLDSNTAVVTITVTAENDAPTAGDDQASTDEDTATDINVLDNDSDVEDTVLAVDGFTQPVSGTTSLNLDDTIRFDPAGDFESLALGESSVVTFSYTISDTDGLTATAQVSVTVHGLNDAPVAIGDHYGTPEDSPLEVSAPGVLGNDSDPDGDTITAVLVSDPVSGSLTLAPGGSFVYTPTAGYTGTDTFSYHAHDGQAASNTAFVTITVTGENDPPVAVNDSYTTTEDHTLTVPVEQGVLTNDSDVDEDDLATVQESGPASGALALADDGSFVYTPTLHFNGVVTFTYHANDGLLDSNTAVVTITVTAENDAPAAEDDQASTDEDTATDINVLDNDSDVEDDELAVDGFTQPVSGTTSLNPNDTIRFDPAGEFESLGLGESSVVTFSYTISDTGGLTATAQVSVTVHGLNDAPTAGYDEASTDEDTVVDFPVLDNDSDVEDDELAVDGFTQPVSGTTSLNSDDTIRFDPAGEFESLGLGESSVVTFSYTISDTGGLTATAQVSVTVHGLNDAPTAGYDEASTDEDTVVDFPVLDNDSDVEDDELAVDGFTQPVSGTTSLNSDDTIRFDPAGEFESLGLGESSVVTFSYTISDTGGLAATAQVSVTVQGLNDVPVAASDQYGTVEDYALAVGAPGVLDNDTDVDGDTLTAILVDDPVSGALALTSDGSFAYTPTLNFNGVVTFTYQANDGLLDSNTIVVTITVTAENDAPTAVDDEAGTDEETAVDIPTLDNDSDVEDTELAVDGFTQPVSGTTSLNPDKTIAFDPAGEFESLGLGQSSVVTFTYTISDSGRLTATAQVSVTVHGLNDAPVADDDLYNLPENSTLTVSVPGVLANDSDVDGDGLTAVKGSDPISGTLTWAGDGSFVYTPTLNFNGVVTFTYHADDGHDPSNTAVVTLTVLGFNEAPVATNDEYFILEDHVSSEPAPGVLDNDDDPDGNQLTAALDEGPATGSLVLNLDGSFVYTPMLHFNGVVTFTYHANDGLLDSNTAVVTITVTAENDAPVATADSYSTTEEIILSVTALEGVLANDEDVEDDPLTAVLVSGPMSGTLLLRPDGSFVYTPTAGFSGVDSFTYRADDGQDLSGMVTVTLTVIARPREYLYLPVVVKPQ